MIVSATQVMNFLLKFLKVIFIFFILLALLLKPASTQIAHYKSLHYPYSQIIYPNDQNLSGEYSQIIQDRQDNTYLSSDHGVLKFNGKGWSFIGMPGRVHLALSDDQVLYAGGADTIAIVSTDFNGQLCLTPLPCRSPQSGFNPGQISRIITLGNELCILSEKGLFTYIN